MASKNRKISDGYINDRSSREQESREAEPAHEAYADQWENPQILDTTNIPERPGYVQRWVRTKLRSEDDQTNVFKKINQGWKPRAMDSVPKGAYIPHIDFNGTDVIGIHGMILMERPIQQHERHAEHNRKTTQAQMAAVTHDVHKVHEIGSGLTRPEINVRSSVSTGITVDDD